LGPLRQNASDKAAPVSSNSADWIISSQPVLAGLHSHYVRLFFFAAVLDVPAQGTPARAVALSSRAAAAAAKGTPAKGDANETLNADRPCRLCIRGNAGILWVMPIAPANSVIDGTGSSVILVKGGHGGGHWARGGYGRAFGWSRGRKVGWHGRGCPPGLWKQGRC
jgi:hypothetical protein